MDAYRLSTIVRGIGGERVSVAGDRVRCACLLARWTHSKGYDSSPSMVVFPEGQHGDPIYSCLSCHERGSLRDLICDLWSLSGRDLLHWIEVLDEETSVEEAQRTARERAARLKGRGGGEYVHRPKVAREALKKTARGQFEPQASIKPFFDYKAAEVELEEIPWEQYESYVGSVPRYAVDPWPKGRGLTIETCKAWELGHDRKMRRLLFPIRDRKGRLVAISGRLYECPVCKLAPPKTVSPNTCTACGYVVYNDGTPLERCPKCNHNEVVKTRKVCERCHKRASPKYLHSTGFKRNYLLYGEHRIRKDKTDGRLYVVEGNADVPAMWQVGYRPVVATLGSWPSENQVEKMIRDADRIIMVADSDEAGKDFVAKVKKLVADRIPVSSKGLPEGHDPNSLMEGLVEFLGPPPYMP